MVGKLRKARRRLPCHPPQESADRRQLEAAPADRNHHITDFFKQACKPDVFSLAPKVPVGMECLQSADVNSSSSPRSPPSKIRRTCLSPSTSSGRPIMEVFQRSMTDDQAVTNGTSVRNEVTSVDLSSSGSEEEGNNELPRFVTSNPPDHTSPAFSTPDISTNGLKKSEKKKSQRMWRDSLDSDDESLHICYSSSDEAEETLQPLDQILQMAKQPFPATPQKEELSMLSLSQSSLPDTPVAKRLQQLPPTPSYDNNLECLVKEKEESERLLKLCVNTGRSSAVTRDWPRCLKNPLCVHSRDQEVCVILLFMPGICQCLKREIQILPGKAPLKCTRKRFSVARVTLRFAPFIYAES